MTTERDTGSRVIDYRHTIHESTDEGDKVQFAGREFVPVGDCVADRRYSLQHFQINTFKYYTFNNNI